MSVLEGRLGLALVLAALALGGRPAHGQAAPVRYWIPGFPFGFGGNPAFGQNANAYGNFPSFDGNDVGGGGFSNTRFNFPNGWFVGSEAGGIGLSMNGINQLGAFGNGGSLAYQGVQFGYKFQNAGAMPVTVFAGFDTLRYNTGVGSPFAAFDTSSTTLPAYGAHAGIEFQPTSNLSLSLGVGYTQQSGSFNSDINSLVLPGASPFGITGRH
jgi:opacity protein-like surface antigen